MPANFDSPIPGSAYWRSSGSSCRSTGISVLVNAQGAIRDEGIDVLPLNEGGEGWSAGTLEAVAALAARYGHSADAAAIRRNATQARVSLATMRAVLWAANSLGVRRTTAADGTVTAVPVHVGAPSDYAIDADAVMPAVGSVPEAPLDAAIGELPVCTPGSTLPEVGGATTSVRSSAVSPVLIMALFGVAVVASFALFEGARGGGKWSTR